MDVMLMLTAAAAFASCLVKAAGPRPAGWSEIPEIDVHTFAASFDLDIE